MIREQKNAFAISCWKPQVFHLQQAIGCVMSIRECGHTEDIIILTFDRQAAPKLERATREYQAEVVVCDPLPHRKQNKEKTEACFLDVNKLYYWSLKEYEKVIGIDCDCIVKGRVDWNIEEFSVFHGDYTGPVCNAVMNLKPSMETFHEMKDLFYRSTFNYETGWNDYGPIKGIEGWTKPNWWFQSSDSFQGFVVYYWHCLKGNFWTNLKRPHNVIYHAGGDLKKSDWYLKRLRELLGGRMTI